MSLVDDPGRAPRAPGRPALGAGGGGGVILMRHPAVLSEGRVYGRHDPPLAPGWEAALDAHLPALDAVRAIHASPAPRARRAAERLAAGLGLSVRLEPRLLELDFGRWEGRRWDALPRPEADIWREDPVRRAPPGGETFAALAARVAAAAAEAPGGALLLTHLGPIRALAMAARGLSFAEAFARPVAHAEILPFGDER